MIAASLLALVALLGVPPGAAHPDSLSSSRVRISASEARLTLRCQVLSLLEVVPQLDADADGEVSASEVGLRKAEVAAYVSEHYRLYVGSDRELAGGTRLRPDLLGVQLLPPGSEPGLGYLKGAVEIDFSYRAEDEIRDLLIESDLFAATSPDHIDLATIEWDGASESFALDQRTPRGRSDPQGRGAFPVFLRLGAQHILSGWDHLAFLAALVLAARRLRSLLYVVTAFTLAHSVTLALAALEFVDVSAFSGLVEIAIALSIAYVAADCLLRPRLARSRWIEAFVFGLVHGLGFAGFLRESLVREKAVGTALFAFNLGVELAQVALVSVAVLALAALPRKRDEEDPFLAPLLLRRVGAAAIVLLGLTWFVQRI